MSFNARVSYTANGSNATFAITFAFLDSTHVKVFLDGVATTAFSVSGSNVIMNSNPANGVVVMIKRETPTDARLVDFQDGSVLTESDLDKSADQNFFIAQEINDESQSAMKLDNSDRFDALNKRIINVADPTAGQDAVTKNYLENVWLSPTDKADINTLAGISGLSSLATNQANINVVATNITNVNNVGSDINKVIEVANDLQEATSEIEVVANNVANVNLVGTDIANVNSVANNIASVNNFGTTYKVSASAPTGVVEGTLWFDTTADTMKVYNGSSFINAGSSVNGTSGRFKYIATANQTTFTGASHSDTGSAVLTYDAGFINVFKNGVHLDPSDYTATDGNNVVLDVGASLNDEIYILTFGTFSLASFSATAITSDTIASARLPVVPISKGGTGLSSVSGQADKVLKVDSTGSSFILGQASSPEVYGFIKSFTASTINYTVTVQSVGGQNKYFINGEQQKTLELLEGNTYIFSYPSAHPFALSTTNGGSHSGGSEYTTGVTRDTSANTLTYVVPSSAPQLYYYCTSHSGMGGQANTPVPANNTLQVITTNQGADNITNTQYNSFTDTLFSASGFTFSIDGTTGNLIATI